MLYVTMLKSMIPKRLMKFPLSSAVYTSNWTILSLYILPSGNFNQFIKTVDGTLNICKIHNLGYNLWCHKYWLSQCKLQEKLLTLLTTYNLSHRVKFVTSIPNDSIIATDNVYVDNTGCGYRMWWFLDSCFDKIGLNTRNKKKYGLLVLKYHLITAFLLFKNNIFLVCSTYLQLWSEINLNFTAEIYKLL